MKLWSWICDRYVKLVRSIDEDTRHYRTDEREWGMLLLAVFGLTFCGVVAIGIAVFAIYGIVVGLITEPVITLITLVSITVVCLPAILAIQAIRKLDVERKAEKARAEAEYNERWRRY